MVFLNDCCMTVRQPSIAIYNHDPDFEKESRSGPKATKGKTTTKISPAVFLLLEGSGTASNEKNVSLALNLICILSPKRFRRWQ